VAKFRANEVGAETETRPNFEGLKNKLKESKRLPSHCEHKQRVERESPTDGRIHEVIFRIRIILLLEPSY
jgi:hypothetical protein